MAPPHPLLFLSLILFCLCLFSYTSAMDAGKSGTSLLTVGEDVEHVSSDIEDALSAPAVISGVFYSTDVDGTDRTSSSVLFPEASTNVSLGYFQRKYFTKRFQLPIILTSRIDQTQLHSVLSSYAKTHFPKSLSVYTISTPPRASIFFSIIWEPNTRNIQWTVTFNQNGAALQASIKKLDGQHYKPSLLESYAFDNVSTILYAGLFLGVATWPSGTKFQAAIGFPAGPLFCCGPTSRWQTLSKKGFKPTSISVVESPVSRRLYVADTWNSYSLTWDGGVDKSAVELRLTLKNLTQSLTPVYIKGYRKSVAPGKHTTLFSYIAYKGASYSPANVTLTTDTSRSAFELLATAILQPPVALTAYAFDGENDALISGSGEMYSAVWPLGI